MQRRDLAREPLVLAADEVCSVQEHLLVATAELLRLRPVDDGCDCAPRQPIVRVRYERFALGSELERPAAIIATPLEVGTSTGRRLVRRGGLGLVVPDLDA